MSKDRMLRQMLVAGVLLVVTLTASACYKNAGENVQPTSNRVDLEDMQPTTLPPSPTPTDVSSPAPMITPTITLKPTITPAELQPTQPVALPTSAPTQAVQPLATSTTSAPAALPSLTPVSTSVPGILITTPGMSDVQPSPTPAPTIDPAHQPTATPVPPEANPCLYVVQPNDTLYSIARAKNVTLADLVAANPGTLPSGEYTILQLGMQLSLPGCAQGPTTTPAIPIIQLTPGTVPQATTAGTSGQHTVQSGETIYSIARLYNIDPNQIITLNNLANPNLIKPGDVLQIPAQ